MLMPLRMGKSLCSVLFGLLLVNSVFAAEWAIEPSVSLREEYNDNIRFTASPHPSVWHSRLSPNVKLSSKTEISEVSGLAQLNISRYAGEQGLNQNDKLFSLLTSLQSERNKWSMNASYKQDSTSESEQLTTGVFAQTRSQRTALVVNPSWSRSLTERVALKMDYNYQDVQYAKQVSHNDYTYQEVSGNLSYQLTERDQIGLKVSYSMNDSAGIRTLSYGGPIYPLPPLGFIQTVVVAEDSQSQKTSITGVQINGTHAFSETLKGTAVAGYRSAQLETAHSCRGFVGVVDEFTGTFCTGALFYDGSLIGPNNDPAISFVDKIKNHGYVFSTTLEKSFNTGKVSGSISREAAPSGSGLVETDKFGLSMNKNFTENMTGSIDTMSYFTRRINPIQSGSRVLTLSPKLNWRFAEQWSLDSGYQYAQLVQDGAAGKIKNNVVYLNLTYNWSKMAISR